MRPGPAPIPAHFSATFFVILRSVDAALDGKIIKNVRCVVVRFADVQRRDPDMQA